jgi:SAM-dependent methyltransferase
MYTRLPPGEDLEVLRGVLPERADVLELGCGVGRLTHPLLDLGHRVVAVDESPDMLAQVRGAETVRARIQDLDLGRRFDVVLLLSNLITVPDERLRRSFLLACRRHVREDGPGFVLLQRPSPGWIDEAEPGERRRGDVILRLRELRRPRPGEIEGLMEYEVDGMTWTQEIHSVLLDDGPLRAELAAADLDLAGYVTADQGWIRAVPRI